MQSEEIIKMAIGNYKKYYDIRIYDVFTGKILSSKSPGHFNKHRPQNFYSETVMLVVGF